MRPKTKLEKRIVELSEKLKPISELQKRYAYKNCFPAVAFRTKNLTHCLECGHSFVTDNKIKNCPLCGVKLNFSDTRKRKDSQSEYFCIVNKAADMLVLRMFIVDKHLKAGETPRYFIAEVVQNWIAPDGSEKVIARRVRWMSRNEWDYYDKMELRRPGYQRYNSVARYMINPTAIYPHRCTLPILKRNGFKGNFHGITPVIFIRSLISSPHFETLLKAKQYNLLRLNRYGGSLSAKWDAIKICIRNNYIVKNEIMWSDYIDLLTRFGKDTRNVKYVCPPSLRKEHDKLVKKQRIIDDRAQAARDRERAERDLQNIAAAEEVYQYQKKSFFDLYFSDGEIDVTPLKSVAEFKEEGDALRHCVFAARYYNKSNSLILSAKKGEERIETVEIDLAGYEIRQCYGMQNKNTKYHDQIINLVNKNIHKIRQCIQKS